MMNFRIKFHIFRESAVLGKMGISARAKFFYHRHGQKILPSARAKNFTIGRGKKFFAPTSRPANGCAIDY